MYNAGLFPLVIFTNNSEDVIVADIVGMSDDFYNEISRMEVSAGLIPTIIDGNVIFVYSEFNGFELEDAFPEVENGDWSAMYSLKVG